MTRMDGKEPPDVTLATLVQSAEALNRKLLPQVPENAIAGVDSIAEWQRRFRLRPLRPVHARE